MPANTISGVDTDRLGPEIGIMRQASFVNRPDIRAHVLGDGGGQSRSGFTAVIPVRQVLEAKPMKGVRNNHDMTVGP